MTRHKTQEPRLLLVDPRSDGLSATAQALREAGFQVVALTRYQAALAMFKVFQPDAVVLAAVAPDFEGCVAARRLQQLSRKTLPLFYVIDAPDPQLRAHCLEAGHGLDALARPLAIGELAAKLNQTLALVRAVARQAERGGSPGRALHDLRTGLHNKRYLLAQIGQELRRTERFGGTFTVLVATLRQQEAVVTAHGPEAADRRLRHAAMLLSQSVREADVVARVGDDTFGLMLPGTPEEEVPTLLARLREKFEGAKVQLGGEWVKTQLGWGSVSFPDVVATAPELLELARGKAKAGAGSRGALDLGGRGS